MTSVIDALAAGDIAAEEFGHREHLLAGWEMLGRDNFLGVCNRYFRVIDQVATAAGAPDKPNVTITVAMLALIAERKAQRPDVDFDRWLQINADLTPTILSRWYTREALSSVAARSRFVLPTR